MERPRDESAGLGDVDPHYTFAELVRLGLGSSAASLRLQQGPGRSPGAGPWPYPAAAILGLPAQGRPWDPARSWSWWHSLLLFVLGAAWGLQFAVLKIATESSLSELGILSVSMVLLAVVYALTLTFRRSWFRPRRRHLSFFVISSLFGFVLPLGGVVLVAEQLTAGIMVFYTEALIPVFTVAIVLTLGTERLSRRRLTAVALALIGVAIAVWPEQVFSSGNRLEGFLIALVVPLAYAIDGVYVAARWPEDLSAFQVVTGEAVTAAAILLPLWLLFEGAAGLPQTMGTGEWAILAFVPVSYLEVYLYFYLLSTAGAVFVSFGCFVSLFAGFFWGLLLLGESHSPLVWLAVAVVSVALYLIVAERRPDGTAGEGALKGSRA